MKKNYRVISISAAAIMLSLFLFLAYRPAQIEKPEQEMTVEEKKEHFLALVLPAVNKIYEERLKRYSKVSELLKKGEKRKKIEYLKKEYKAATDEELLAVLMPHPKSIALAQAAMESSWGTSRFLKEANNVFGIWSYNKDEPRIAAGKKRGEKTVWVKKYPSIEASIADYYRVLARGPAYKEFRRLKMQTDDPYALADKLTNYSEKRHAYCEELISVIKFNKFYLYDRKD